MRGHNFYFSKTNSITLNGRPNSYYKYQNITIIEFLNENNNQSIIKFKYYFNNGLI